MLSYLDRGIRTQTLGLGDTPEKTYQTPKFKKYEEIYGELCRKYEENKKKYEGRMKE